MTQTLALLSKKKLKLLILPYDSVHTTMKKDLHLKPYKHHRCQEITEAHMQQRLEFCRWVLDGNIEPKYIIFTEGKRFCLRSCFNRQNTRYWSIENPHVYDDSVKQGGEKTMGWVT